MAKVHHRRLTATQQHAVHDILWHTLGAFGASENSRRLLSKILTRSEKIMLGRRVQVAKMLLEGKSYTAVQRRLRVGESTIISVYEWLEALEESDRRRLLQC